MKGKSNLQTKKSDKILEMSEEILLEQIAQLFSNPQYSELLAADPDKAIADFGLDPKEVYRLLRDPSKFSQIIKSCKAK